jgi:Prophage CP4-57 regulatory protein (AlpA)
MGAVRYLTQKELPSKGINYHINHLRRLWAEGKFPKPIKMSERKLVWREDVIDAWWAKKEKGSARRA